jgi:hypothetical protein
MLGLFFSSSANAESWPLLSSKEMSGPLLSLDLVGEFTPLICKIEQQAFCLRIVSRCHPCLALFGALTAFVATATAKGSTNVSS